MIPLPIEWTYIISIIFGLIFGSFANVIIYRLPQNKSIAYPNSFCPKCKKRISWYDNIPVFSFLLLKGKCRHCRKKISLRYPLIEFMTALLFLAATIRFGWNWTLWIRDWPFILLLVCITFIDLDHRIIPDSLNFIGLGLGLITSFWVSEPGWILSFSGAVLGFCLFYFLALIYYKWSGQHGLGGGDIKFLAMLGAYVGIEGVFATILISSVLGSILGILLALYHKEKNVMKSSLPYGPFLVIGGLYYYFLGEYLWFPFMKLT